MQFLNSLFGGSENLWLTVGFALGLVIVLIVLGVWLLKLLSAAAGGAGRGRGRRLAIVETIAVGPRRQLMIVRRDNVEHLILTGGPADVVVESGIPIEERALRRAPVAQRAGAQGHGASPLERLRELNTSDAQRRAMPRHPGLMRPVSQMERGGSGMEPQISAIGPRDSAKDLGQKAGGGRTGFDEGDAEAVRRTAKRN